MLTPEELIKKKNSSISVVYYKFLLAFGRFGRDYLYCFFEGNDDPIYYCQLIRRYCEIYEVFVCNGKDNVISIYELLNSNGYEKCKIALFIDKDFDLPCKNTKFLETQRYSIENYFCDISVIGRILNNEFHLQTYDKEYENCIDLYKKTFSEFHDCVIEFNAWYFCFKQLPIEIIKCSNVCLENKLPSGFITFDFDNKITKNYSVSDIYSIYPFAPVIDKAEICKVEKIFKEGDLSNILRGKYEIEFVIKYFKFLISDANNKNKKKYLTKKTTMSFQDDKFLSSYVQYASYDDKALQYISSIFR